MSCLTLSFGARPGTPASRRALPPIEARSCARRPRAVQARALETGPTDEAAPGAPQVLAAAPDPPELACYGTGQEVECVFPDAPPGEARDAAVVSTSGRPSEGDQGPLAGALDGLILVSPFFFWGTSMVVMKGLAPHTTPLLVAAWRLVPAGLVLLGWAAASGRKQPTDTMAWPAIALFGLVDGACFQGFLAEGLQRTSAGLGSVIIDSQPLTVALLASLLFGERLGVAGFAGLGLGVLGLSLLEVPPSVLAGLPGWLAHVGAGSAGPAAGSADWSLWDSGEWWMLLAAQSMAVGTVMVRWVAKYADPVVATGWHMVLGGLPLLALSAAQESSLYPDTLGQLTGSDVLGLLYVSLLGSAASYGVFFWKASSGSLTALSSLTFLTPMFAAGAGFLALGETLTPLQLAGAGVTLGAVALINSAPRGKEGSAAKQE